jgi:uncharacterized protein (DUF302 family)
MYKFEVASDKNIDKVFLEIGNRLKEKGYAVLSYVDLKQILKEKLGRDFHGYYIMEVCKPGAAMELISTDSDYGLFLPCKIVLEELTPSRTTIKMLLVTEMSKAFLDGSNTAEKYQNEILETVKSI